MKSEAREPDVNAAEDQEPAPPKVGRAGRNLPAAIGVGVLLGTLILVTLFTVRVVWVGVICLAVGLGAYELVSALAHAGLRVPRIPVTLAAAAIPAAAYARGTDGLVLAFFIAVVGCMHGLRVSGSAESVGRETTRAVVKAIFLVLALDAFFSVLFEKLGV